MEQDRRDSPPLWLKPPVTALLRRQCRPSSSLINNPVTLVILLPPLALILLFCLLSPFGSHNFQTIQISLVKNRWDSLNIVLVLFAILCGVAAKMFDQESEAGAEEAPVHKSNVSSMIMNDSFSLGIPEIGTFQIFDDFDITNIYAPESKIMRCCEGRSEKERNDLDIKVIQVDTCVLRQASLLSQSENSQAPPAPPSYQPLKSAEPEPTRQKSRRRQSPKSFVYTEKQLNGSEIYKSGSPPPPPPPPEQKRGDKIERKKSGATKEIVTAIASLYNQTKKKPNQKTTNIYSNRTVSATAKFISPTPPPPPPSIFHNMFREATKSKRIHSEDSPIPPTPPPLPQAAVKPPPPSSIFNNIFKSGAKSKRFNSSTTPPPPTPLLPSSTLNHLSKSESKSKRYYSSLAFQSPPSPPPPPPKSETILRRTPKPPLLARVHKDYLYHSEENVNIFGIQSPPSQFEYAEQPEVERIDDWTTNVSESVREGIHSGGSVFCPSPDVNTKAEKFIARLRDEWRSDKMNSYREKL